MMNNESATVICMKNEPGRACGLSPARIGVATAGIYECQFLLPHGTGAASEDKWMLQPSMNRPGKSGMVPVGTFAAAREMAQRIVEIAGHCGRRRRSCGLNIDTKQDFLNYGETAILVAEVIADTRMLPTSIGVFGSWGAWKSTLLNIIEQDRMPVIIERADWQLWLGEEDGDVTALLRPFPADRLRIWPVERTVNNVRNDGPELLVPCSFPVEQPVLA
jgi:hypothetical protein